MAIAKRGLARGGQMNVKHSTLRREDASAVAKAMADGMEGEENLKICVFTKRTTVLEMEKWG